MNATTQRGFFILADITGFTPFVADTELEHSNEILHEILEGLLSHMTPRFTLAEVEGDAVFVYSPSDKLTRGDTILEIIESTYTAFRDEKNNLRRVKSCNCKACQMAPLLDLKFIVHYGEYILNNVSGKKKPLGTSVNVAHRLLKNKVTEATGWNAYVLMTRACADAIGIDVTNVHRQTEYFDHIGSVDTFSVDLDDLYKTSVRNRRVYISKDDADGVVERDFSVSPDYLWEWLNEPKLRSRWSIETEWNVGMRPLGRARKGATNHCTKSGVTEKILDYRPFDYYTSSMSRGLFRIILTSEFKEIPGGTRLSWHVKIKSFLPKVISRILCKLMLGKGMKVNQAFDNLSQLVEAEKVKREELV